MGEQSVPAEILLVEDNPGDVRLTQEAFRDAQIENTLHVARDGAEAMAFLERSVAQAAAPSPDIVLLDLNLPRKNGEEVLEEVREDPSLRRLPVIILTSSEAESDVVKSYELNANAYLTKPVDPGEFIDTVQSLQEFWLSIVKLPPKSGDAPHDG
jgi:CheY-like chemotaxis protein